MDIEQSALLIARTYGFEIIKDPRFVNMLMDYRAFDSCKALKNILCSMITTGYMSRLYDNRDDSIERRSLSLQFIKEFGFAEDLVNSLVDLLFSRVYHEYNNITGLSSVEKINTPKPGLNGREEISRRRLPILLVTECSGVVSPSMIGSIYDACENLFMMLRNFSVSNPGVEIVMNDLRYNDQVNWEYDNPQQLNDFVMHPIVTKGCNMVGMAFMELDSYLNRFNPNSIFAPIIILISVSNSFDSYELPLLTLQQKDLFNQSIKLGISIGNNADTKLLTDFSGSIESVFRVHNIDLLSRYIKLKQLYRE